MYSKGEPHEDISPENENPVFEEPYYLKGAYLWTEVGVSVGVLVLIFFILWLRRRETVSKATSECSGTHPASPTKCTTFDLSSSVENSLNFPSAFIDSPRRMHHSLSMDVGSPFYDISKHCVQPKSYLTRWNSLTSPRCSLVPLGSIQPDLYRSSDSEDPDLPPPPTNSGRLWFSILFRREDNELEITLIRAKYLPGRGLYLGARDPFVKIYLLPDEENFKQSQVRRRTLSPKYNETFIFKVASNEVTSRSLRFSVYDLDKRKVRHSLGHAVVCLSKVDISTNQVVWRDLEKTSQERRCEGEIQISLMCNPYNNRLKVAVCKVKNVQGIDSGEASIYTKVHLFHGRKLMKTKRTSPQHVIGPSKSELIFHETFTYTVPARFYESCYLQLVTVVTGGSPLVKDMVHGRVRVGPFLFSRGDQLLHWQEMVTNPRSLITRWHQLEAPSS